MDPHRLRIRFLSAIVTVVAMFNLLVNDAAIRYASNSDSSGVDNAMRIDRQEWKLRSPTDVTNKVSATPSKIQLSSNATGIHSSEHDKNLWENSTVIPRWMKDYFDWHRKERQKLNESNWESYNYLLHRCVKSDIKCSGASDRLKAIPSVILMASQAQPRRLLFIAWSRPAPLEEFLLPPKGGFDWRLPEWLAEKVELERRGPKFWLDDDNEDQWPFNPDKVVRIKSIHGPQYYEKMRKPDDYSFDQVYHDVWSTVFEPSPAILTLVAQQMQELHLTPGEYVGAHVRAMYVSDTRMGNEEQAAVNCASQLMPGSPIYFASDSINTTRQALLYGKSKNATIVARMSDTEPIHLDRGRDFLVNSNDWSGRPASDFYNVFIDLFVLAGGRCVTYGVGGFGSWASLLSRNRSCSMNHRTGNCKWTDAKTET